LVPTSPSDGMRDRCWCLHHHRLMVHPFGVDVSISSPPDGTLFGVDVYSSTVHLALMPPSSPPDGTLDWHWCLPHHRRIFYASPTLMSISWLPEGTPDRYW
jgi:hypothetical protein